ncbi:hypothetical protein HOY82DRAFT_554761 [Tuber indicum]|nr:hypothetical protein HOY82DRAFT_554761 [Tuber indicum]
MITPLRKGPHLILHHLLILFKIPASPHPSRRNYNPPQCPPALKHRNKTASGITRCKGSSQQASLVTEKRTDLS